MRIPLAAAGRREMALITLLIGGGGAACFVAAGSGHAWCWPLGVVLALGWGAGLTFFRDPERTTPREPGILVAPADGKVVETVTLEHHDDVGGPATRISIFMSILDVHVNRSPCAGLVRAIRYQPGRFLDARDVRSGQVNEANTIVIDPIGSNDGPVVVRQIAGLIARRVICSLKVGDRVEAGQRIGMIKFGSRIELIVPACHRYRPTVCPGDHARGASTILARREPSAVHAARTPPAAGS